MTKHIWKKKIQGTEKGKKSKDTESEEAGMKNGMKEIVLKCNRDFSSGTVVKNLPCNAGDLGSIPGRRTTILHALEQLSPRTTIKESVGFSERSRVL